MAEFLAPRRYLRDRQRRPASSLLRAVDVSVSERRGPHGARSQLHLRRPAGPLSHDARRRSSISHRFRQFRVASGERRHSHRGTPSEVHRGAHSRVVLFASAHRRCLRLAQGVPQPRQRVHPLDAMDIPEVLRGRSGLQGRGVRELVSWLSDCAGQRAGAHRRDVRALQRPGGGAQAVSVVLPNHRIRPASARRRRKRRLAGARQDHAAQLDRSF